MYVLPLSNTLKSSSATTTALHVFLIFRPNTRVKVDFASKETGVHRITHFDRVMSPFKMGF